MDMHSVKPSVPLIRIQHTLPVVLETNPKFRGRRARGMRRYLARANLEIRVEDWRDCCTTDSRVKRQCFAKTNTIAAR